MINSPVKYITMDRNIRFDSTDSEVYLTPKHLVDGLESGDPEVYLTPKHLIEKYYLSADGTENTDIYEIDNMRSNVLGQSVRRRQEEDISVQEEEDEDGYTLATDRVISVTQIPLNPTTPVKSNRGNGTTLFQRLHKHRYIISAFVVGFVGAISLAIIGVVIYSVISSSNIEQGNFMCSIISNHCIKNIEINSIMFCFVLQAK